MLHPSYYDLMEVVNSSVEQGEEPVVSSRYSIVIATAKRARQIIDGDKALVPGDSKKPLSLAVEEINQAKVKILHDDTKECDEDVIAEDETEASEEDIEETEVSEEAEVSEETEASEEE